MHWNRRKFLQAAGLGGASFFLPSLGRAQSNGEPPLRFVLVCTQLGPEISGYRMKPADAPTSILERSNYDPQWDQVPDDASWDLPLGSVDRSQFSYCLDPLYDLREDVLAFDGLCLAAAAIDDLGDAHAQGFLASVTGHPAAYEKTSQKSHAGAPSIDRRIGRWLRQQDPSLTDLASLNLRVSPWGYGGASTDGFHYFFFDEDANGDIVRTPVDQDPRALFDRLFPNPETETDPFQQRQLDVLNLVSDRYAGVDRRLSTDDRAKLDQHRQLLLDIQRRVEAQQNLVCARPERFERENPRPPRDEIYRPTVDAFMDLIVASLSCGLTRTVGLSLPTPPFGLIGARDGENYHHYYSHGSAPRKAFAERGSPDYEQWSGAYEVQRNKTRHQLGLVAELAAKLKAIPEGDGTLLDNTVILWADEISHGGHGHDQWPAVVVGGRKVLRTGRYVRLPRNIPSPWTKNWGPQFVGTPNNQLLVGLCQAMGMPIEDFGIPSLQGEVLRGPHEGQQQTISLRGPLPGLLI